MWKKVLATCLIIGFCSYYTLAESQIKPSTGFYVTDEISIDGPALFYGVSGDQRRELWSVHCAQPLRSCVARAPGLVLSVDENGAPWLISVTPPGTRISMQTRNYTRNVPHLFNQALNADSIRRLSAEKAFVVVEENGSVVLRARTTGLNKVVDYLTWIRGSTARTLRDARLWPRNGDIRVQDMTPEVLERFEVMQRRALEAQRQLVPSTKPQIEFAIRAQNGDSYYAPDGRSGY